MFRFNKKITEFNWKYALGEISLIFIGITLAIWFNNWNQSRINEDKKNQYLVDLKSDLQNDHGELSYLINANQSRMRRINLLNEVLINSETLINCDSAQKYLASASFINVFTGSSTVFEDLENTGNLLLFDDNILKRRIMKYYAGADSRKKYEDLNTRFHINTIGVFLKENWNTGALFRIGMDEKELNENIQIDECEYTRRYVARFREDLQLRQELMNHVNFSFFIMKSNNTAYLEMRTEIEELLNQLNLE